MNPYQKMMVVANWADDFMDIIRISSRKWVDGKAYEMEVNWKLLENEGVSHVTDGLAMPREEAQALMDRLWGCGIRPTETKSTPGQLAATEDHLKTTKEYLDRMTKLVEMDFNLLLKKGPSFIYQNESKSNS